LIIRRAKFDALLDVSIGSDNADSILFHGPAPLGTGRNGIAIDI
jgi:hypothetical protein